MDVTTDQVTTTPALRKDIPANTDGCYVMQVLANRHTATGSMDVRLEVSGWVGVKHKDKASYNQGVETPSQYRLFDFYSELELLYDAPTLCSRGCLLFINANI
jgi:hypothetical protein